MVLEEEENQSHFPACPTHMSLKTTICGWNLFLAICLLITGVVIGSIGAAKYAPYAGFINVRCFIGY